MRHTNPVSSSRLFLTFAVFVSVLLTCNVMADTATPPVTDTYVQRLSTSDYSSGTELKPRFGGGTGLNLRKAYMRYDLTTVGGTATGAVFKVTPTYVGGTQSYVFKVYGLDNGDAQENWNASTINWSNAPAFTDSAGTVDTGAATLLGTFSLSISSADVGTTYTMTDETGSALVDFINSDTNDMVTLIMVQNSILYNPYEVFFASDEHATYNGPVLELSGVSSAVLIETDVSSLNVSEGSTNSFQVKLSTQPSSSVTVSVARVSGDSDLSVSSGASLVFSTSNWDSYQTVVLAAAEDADYDDDSAVFNCTSPDATQTSVTATETDNDQPSVISDVSSLSVDEGQFGSFQIKLESDPVQTVTVAVSRTAGDTDIAVRTASVVFSTSDWDSWQSISLLAEDDADEVNGTATVHCAVSGYDAVDVSVSEQDNDGAGMTGFSVPDLVDTTVSESDSNDRSGDTELKTRWGFAASTHRKSYLRYDLTTISGTATAASFRMTATAVPTADTFEYDVYGLHNGDVNENWDPAVTYSNAPAYAYDPDKVDTNAASLLGTFSLALTTNDVGQEFTMADATGSALADFINADTNEQVTLIIVAKELLSNGELYFASAEHATIPAPVLEVEGITRIVQLQASTSTPAVVENGTGEFDVTLRIQPESTVTVSVSRISGDTDITIQSGASLVFTSSDWNVPQTVTLAAADDVDVVSGSAVIRCSADGVPDLDVTAVEVEDDVLTILTQPSELTIAKGQTATFDVKLSTVPPSTVDVAVGLASGNTNVTVISGGALTFTTSDWDSWQTVTLDVNGSSDYSQASMECTSSNAATGSVTVDISAPSDTYIPIEGNAFHVVAADVDGDGTNELVYACYDGLIAAINPETTQTLWRAHIGGMPFDLKSEDINGDGKAETFAACADGKLYAFADDGSTNWTYDSGWVMFAVDIAWIDGTPIIGCGGMDSSLTALDTNGTVLDTFFDMTKFKVCHTRLNAYDIDGDGNDEFLARDGRDRGLLFEFSSNTLSLVWDKYWTKTDGASQAANYDTTFGDANNDGKIEIVHGASFDQHQAVFLFNTNASPDTDYICRAFGVGWLVGYENRDEYFSTAYVNVRDMTADAGNEVLSIAGGTAQIYSFETNYYDAVSSQYRSVVRVDSKLAFTDVIIDGDILYLGSVPNGDKTLYKINLAQANLGWTNDFVHLERHGVPVDIANTLAGLEDEILAYNGQAPDRGKYTYRLRKLPSDSEAVAFGYEAALIANSFPYTNSLGENIFQSEALLYGGFAQSYTASSIVQTVSMLEATNIPFVLGVAHGPEVFCKDMGLDSVSLAELVYSNAPNTLRGFIISEDSEGVLNGTNLFVEYHAPLLDWCVDNDKRFTMDEKGAWWMNFPSIEEYYDALFGGERAAALVPTAEDSNSRTPELNLFARFGLRQAGLVDNWESMLINDNFCANRYFEWETPRHGHPHFRYYVCHTLLGSRTFSPRYDPTVSGRAWNKMGEESLEVAFHMIGKGLLFQPKVSEMIGMNNVGIVMHTPPEYWLYDAENFHGGRGGFLEIPEMYDAIIPFNGVSFSYAPMAEASLQKVLCHKERQFGTHIPATPYGPFVIVPNHTDLDAVEGVDSWWHTDGIELWREGEAHLTGAAAAAALQASFEASASNLPFRATGDDIFYHTIAPEFTNTYWIYAIDPGWIDPSDRDVTMKIQIPGEFSVIDKLTGDSISVNAQKEFSFTVPAGAMRLFEAIPVSPTTIEVSTNALSVTEGSTATFQVRLTAAPDADRTVRVARKHGDTDITATGGTNLVFTTSDWSTWQTVTLSAIADYDTTNSETVIRCHSLGLPDTEVIATEADTGVALGVETDVSVITVAERGTNTFQVRLTSNPGTTVQVDVSRTSGDSDITVLAGSTLTFTTGDWDSWQTVTLAAANDDDAKDSSAVILCSLASGYDTEVVATEDDKAIELYFDFGSTNYPTAGNWNNVTGTSGLQLTDAIDSQGLNTGVGIDITDSFVRTDEGGVETNLLYPVTAQQDSLVVNMLTVNTSAVVRVTGITGEKCDVTLFGSTTLPTYRAAYTVGTNTVTLWNSDNEEHSVTIHDVVPVDGAIDVFITGYIASDYAYLGAMVLSYEVPIQVVATPSTVAIAEGSTNSFGVRLTANPWETVTVSVSRVSGDTDITVTSGTELVFTPENYLTEQTVGLAAATDADKLHGTAAIECAAPALAHTATVTAVEMDADASIVTSVSSLIVPENGTNTFTVELDAQPYSAITVSVSNVSGDTDISVVSGASLIFATNNWSVPQTVSLTGANDVDSSNGTAIVSCSATGMSNADVTVTENDDDWIAYELFAYEPFAYDVGAIGGADGGMGWTGAWGSDTNFTVISPATELVYSNASGVYIPGGNRALQASGNNSPMLSRSLPNLKQDFYYSFLISMTAGAIDYDNHMLIGDLNGASESGASFGRFSNGTADNLAGAIADNVANEVLAQTLTQNQTYMLVCKFTWDATDLRYAQVDVWVNPTSRTAEEAVYHLTATDTGGFCAGGFNELDIAQQVLDVGDSFVIDEIRMGAVWADVVAPQLATIELSDTAVSIDEASTNTFDVRLTANPGETLTVTVARVTGDTDITVDSGASLVFTTSDWATWQTVTLAAADDVDEDNGVATIRCSSDGLADADVTATELDDDGPVPFTLLFDYGQSGANETTNTGWNNITSLTTASPLAVVLDSDGNTTDVTYAQSSPASVAHDSYSGIAITDLSYPDSAWRDDLSVSASQSFTITLSNLHTNQLFDITILGSRASSAADYTTYTIGSLTNRIFSEYNDTDRTGAEDISASATDLAIFTNIAPSASGEIVITVNDSTAYKYINMMEVATVSTSGSGGGGSSNVQIQASSTSVSVPEGSTNTFQLKLTEQPVADTTVSVSRVSGDTDITVSGGSSLVFSTANWDTYQLVTLSAAEDADLISSTASILCVADGLSNLTVTATEADNDSATTNKILLIGNSYTLNSDLQGIFRELIEASGRSAVVDVSGAGGMDLKWHWDVGSPVGDATNKIHTGNYDYVMLQEYSEAAFTARLTNSFQPYAPLFHDYITNHNAKTLFYAHWAKAPYILEEGIPQAQTNVNAMYFNMADQLGDQAEASPVGIAFKRGLEQNQQLYDALQDELNSVYNTNGLYLGNGDLSHPGMKGVYLVSCTFYSTIYQQSPEGIPLYYIDAYLKSLSLSTNEALFYQRLAWDAYQYHHAVNPPQLTLNTSTNMGGIGTMVSFTADASDDSAITDYTWNFGDGTVTNGAALTNVTHTYTEAGFFDAWVRVTDSSNETERIGEVIFIDNSGPTLSSASSIDSNSVVLTFSKALDQTTAETTGNYSLSGGLSVSAAVLSGSQVTLTPSSSFTESTSYTVTVSNVEDLYGNAVTSGTSAVFQYVPDTSVYYTVLFDLGDGAYPTAGNWNNVTNADTGLWVQDAVDSDGNATTLDLRITDAFVGALNQGLVINSLYPDTARQDALYVIGGHLAGPGDDTQAVIRVEGLDPANTYDISFFASQTSQYHNTHFTIGAVDVNLEASGNLNNEVSIQDVSPDGSGMIDIQVWADEYCDYGVLGVLKIVYADNSAASAAALDDLREGCRLEVTYRNILKDSFDSTQLASLNNFRDWTNSSGSYTAASYTNILNLWLNDQPLTAVQSNHLPIVKAAYIRQAWDTAGAQQRSVSNEAWDVYATSVRTNGEALMIKGFSGEALSDAEIDALRDYCIYIQMQSTGAERLPYQLGITRSESTPFEIGEDAPQFMLRKAETVFDTQAFNDAALQDMKKFLTSDGVTEVLNLFAGYTNVSGTCIAKAFPASVSNETDYVRRQTNGTRPVVLMMGKSSDVMLRRNIPIMDAFYQAYKDVADIYIVHTSYHDSFSTAPYYYGPYAGEDNERVPWQWTEEDFAQDVRRSMIRYPSLSIPFLMDDSTHRNRNSFFNGGGSAHFVIIDCDGKVAYAAPQIQSEGWTPFDAILQVNDVEYELRRVLANNGLAEAGRDRDEVNVLRQAMIDNGALTSYRPVSTVPLWLTGQITAIDTNNNTVTVQRPVVNTNAMWGYNIIQENDPVVDLGSLEAPANLALLNHWISDGQKEYTLAIGAGSTNFSFATSVDTNVTEVYLNGLPVEIGSLQAGDFISAMYNDTTDETNSVIKPLYFRATRTNQQVVVSTSALSVTEGATNSFTVQLSSAPAASVDVSIDISGDSDLTLVSASTLTFTTSNWNSAQTVLVAAAIDSDATDGSALIRCSANGPLGANVSVAEQDTGAHFVDRPMLFDFGVSSATTPGNWNNVTDKTTGTKITSAVATNGYATGIALTITDAFNYEINGGVVTNVLYPVTAQRDYFRVNSADTTGAFQLSGLNSNTLYSFTFFGSMTSTPADTKFTINGMDVVLDTYLNESNTVSIANVLPDGSGTITVTVMRNSTGSGALSVMEVTTSEYTGGPAASIVTDLSNLNVAEGSTNVFHVKLSAQPAEDTTVTVSRASGDTDITVSGGASLVFTTNDWDTYQLVTLSAAEDADTSSDPATITCASTGMSAVDVTATEIDNDALQMQLSTSSVTVPEGSTNIFQVRLTAQPATDTTVTVSRTAGDTDITVSDGTALVFSTANWNTYQDVTLSAAEDADTTSDQATITCVSSGLTSQDVTATESDNDSAGGGGSGAAFEGLVAAWNFQDVTAIVTNTSATVLAPTGMVSAVLTHSDPSQLRYMANATAALGANSSTLGDAITAGKYFTWTMNVEAGYQLTITNVTLTTDSYSPVTGAVFSSVSGFTDGDQLMLINQGTQTTSADTSLGGITNQVEFRLYGFAGDASTDRLIIGDAYSSGSTQNDVRVYGYISEIPALMVSTTDVQVAEGSTNSFQVKLSANPMADTTVTVSRISGDTDISVSGGATLVFSSANWSNWQEVTLSAAQDDDVADSSATIECVLTGLDSLSVTATEADDDTMALSLSTNAVGVAEGSTGTFDVKLTAQPLVDTTVTVSRISGDTDITVSGGASLVFASTNWSTWQTVTLSAAEDADTWDSTATIECASTGMTSENVTATEVDNDEPVGGPLGTYLFTGTVLTGDARTPHTESNAVANITFGAFTRNNVDAEGDSDSDNVFCSDAWSDNTSIDTNEYIAFTLNVDTGYEVTVTNMTFDWSAANYRSPENFRVAIFRNGSSMDSLDWDTGSGNSGSVIFDVSDFAAASNETIEVRIYAWNTLAYDINDIFSVDNVTVNGYVQSTAGRSMALSAAINLIAENEALSADAATVSITKALIAGSNLVGVNVEADSLSALLGSQLLVDDQILIYDAVSAGYQTVADLSAATVPAGGAFWLETTVARDLVLTGAVRTTKDLLVVEGLQLMANPLAQSADLQSMGLNGTRNANPALCDKVSVLVNGLYQIYGLDADGIWYKADDKKVWSRKIKAVETIDLGEGFWYDAQKPFVWTAE